MGFLIIIIIFSAVIWAGIRVSYKINDANRTKIMLILWLFLSMGIKLGCLLGPDSLQGSDWLGFIFSIPGFMLFDGFFVSFWKIRPKGISMWAILLIGFSWYQVFALYTLIKLG